MTNTRTNTQEISRAWIVGAAIAMTLAASAPVQAQSYGSQGSFNNGFAQHPGATDALKNGARAQDYRKRLATARMNRDTRRLLNGNSSQSRMLRERGNMARHTRHDPKMRQMFQRRGVDAQRRHSYSSNRSFRTGPRRSSYVSRSSTRTAGRKWGYGSTGSRSSLKTNSARYTRSSMRSVRTARSLRTTRTAARTARYARAARYAKYATGGGIVAGLAGVDPISMGIHAATRPKHFANRAAYYARNPHKGVHQMGKNVVNNTRKIGCGVVNVFKKKRNRSRCR